MNEALEFRDDITLDTSARTVTREGYLIAPAVLAYAGVFQYSAGELGIPNRRADEKVNVYRSAKMLADSVESYDNQPIALQHQWITAANWRGVAVGDVRDVEMRGDDMHGTVIIRDAEAIQAIDKGRKQLSGGHQGHIAQRPGTYKGQQYEFEQIDSTGNHIAVIEKARLGPRCRIWDSAPPEPNKEPTMITRVFDGLSVSLENEQSGQVFDRVVRTLDETRKEIDALKKAPVKIKLGDKEMTEAEAQTLYDCRCQELAAAAAKVQTPEQIHALVVSRSNAITQAKDMVPDFKVNDEETAHAIRVRALDAVIAKDDMAKEMLTAAIGTTKLADAKPEAVEVAFATIAAGLRKAKDARKVTDSRSQVGRIADAGSSAAVTDDPRAAAMQRMSDAWKTPKSEVN